MSSKLDEILDGGISGNIYVDKAGDGRHTFEQTAKNKAKQQLKSLFKELIGEDGVIRAHHNEIQEEAILVRNDLKAELRKAVDLL